MESGNEEEEEVVVAVPTTSNETLSDLRELSIRCRELLHELSTDDGGAATAEGLEARELMATFNIWAANMGVFREGRQSLASRLQSTPQISELVRQLLELLKRDLCKSAPSDDDGFLDSNRVNREGNHNRRW